MDWGRGEVQLGVNLGARATFCLEENVQCGVCVCTCACV